MANACGRDLQEDDHGEEHVKTRQAGVVPTTAAVGHQVGGHARQRLQNESVTCMCEDRKINHADCRLERKVIFGSTASPVSSDYSHRTLLGSWPKRAWFHYF